MGKVDKKQRVKALVVKAILTVQKLGTIQVAAPLGVRVNHQTGKLETPVDLKLIGKPVFTATVVPHKLINQGIQHASLGIKKSHHGNCRLDLPSKLNLEIPIYSMHDVPKILPGDHVQEKAEVESIDIRGIKDPNYYGCESKAILIINVVYRVKVTILREEVITIPKPCEQSKYDYYAHADELEDTIINENNINVIVNPHHVYDDYHDNCF